MIQTECLCKKFDQTEALADVSLHVVRGSVYGLIGPNGAGKSTLIRTLAGIYRPDAGNICIDGEPVWENARLKSRIGTIPDDVFYYLSATTQDMMHYYRGLYPQFDTVRYHRLKEIFSSVDERAPIRKLSKGMQKQAAFWLTICCRPDVLLLDEPVDGLDPVMRRRVWSLLLADVAECGTTVLVSSHNLRELEDVCDHVGVMHCGRLLLERSLSELENNITKLQIVFPGEAPAWPDTFPILHDTAMGKMHTLILRGSPEAVSARYGALQPVYMEALPLTLEEVFLYEMGGMDYAVKEVLL